MTGPKKIEEIVTSDGDEWFTLFGTVESLTPESDLHPKKRQEGYLFDGTEKIRFVSWDDSIQLKLGETYKIKSAVTNLYRGKISISLNSRTKITESCKEDIPWEISDKPRSLILKEIESIGPKNSESIDKNKFEVDIDVLYKKDVPLDKPISFIESNLYDSEKITEAEEYNNLPPLTGLGTHSWSVYGINPHNELVLGYMGRIGGVTGRAPYVDRSKLQTVLSTCSLLDDDRSELQVKSEGKIKWMNLADCGNCGGEFEIEPIIGVNPYNPTESYLSYYDWWRDTERHNIDVPNCPNCGKKELEPPETPNNIHIIRRVKLSDIDNIRDIETELGKAFDFDANIQYKTTKCMEILSEEIVSNIPNEISNKIEKSRVISSGDRGLRGITRRYIRYEFSEIISESELKLVAEASMSKGEGIGRIQDKNKKTIVDLTFH